jgi:hypothetical protein
LKCSSGLVWCCRPWWENYTQGITRRPEHADHLVISLIKSVDEKYLRIIQLGSFHIGFWSPVLMVFSPLIKIFAAHIVYKKYYNQQYTVNNCTDSQEFSYIQRYWKCLNVDCAILTHGNILYGQPKVCDSSTPKLFLPIVFVLVHVCSLTMRQSTRRGCVVGQRGQRGHHLPVFGKVPRRKYRPCVVVVFLCSAQENKNHHHYMDHIFQWSQGSCQKLTRCRQG